MNVKTRKVRKPMQSRAPTTATGRTTLSGAIAARRGERKKTAVTPRRAMAISTPMASAISLPSNQRAMARETVTPAISAPHPKMAKPMHATFALPGIEGQNELKNSQPKPPPTK